MSGSPSLTAAARKRLKTLGRRCGNERAIPSNSRPAPNQRGVPHGSDWRARVLPDLAGGFTHQPGAVDKTQARKSDLEGVLKLANLQAVRANALEIRRAERCQAAQARPSPLPKALKRWPSNRSMPRSVPAQMKPAAACASGLMRNCPRPALRPQVWNGRRPRGSCGAAPAPDPQPNSSKHSHRRIMPRPPPPGPAGCQGEPPKVH